MAAAEEAELLEATVELVVSAALEVGSEELEATAELEMDLELEAAAELVEADVVKVIEELEGADEGEVP